MTMQYIARPLAEKGCRVMLFVSSAFFYLPSYWPTLPPPIRRETLQPTTHTQDLFGRGYSDAPGDVEYDTRLFVTQILLVLASSRLAWTGEGGLSVVGYSLGGGIAANFAAAFPHLVETLVLLAPAGLIRPANFGLASRLVFVSGLVPERLLACLTRWRMRKPIAGAVSKKPRRSSSSAAIRGGGGGESLLDTATREIVDPDEEDEENEEDEEEEEAGGPTTQTPFEREVERVVHWTLDHHEGFVPAFMSTLRAGPLMGQQEHWRQLARRPPGTTAVLLGRRDELVQRDDYAEDALPLLGGPANVFWRVVPGGHNFPFTHAPDALACLYEFWGMGMGGEEKH